MAGANKPDTHLRGVVPGTHFQAEYADLREADPGDACAKCGAPLAVERVIEIGNIFRLGTKYSVPLGALYLDEQGQERPIVMGSYGIGPARIAAAAIEQNHDKDGMIWPETIAPFEVHLLVVNVKDAKMAGMAEELYGALTAAGLDVLYDDRDERARREVQGRRPARLPAAGHGREPGPERRRGGGPPPPDGRGRALSPRRTSRPTSGGCWGGPREPGRRRSVHALALGAAGGLDGGDQHLLHRRLLCRARRAGSSSPSCGG